MKISIFGLGYVGSVSSACFSLMGHEVVGVDSKIEKNEMINSGEAPIFENNLNDMIAQSVSKGKLFATEDINYAINNSSLSILCVGTPSLEDGGIELSYVKKVCAEIGNCLKQKDSYHAIVVRSTIPPGTIENVLIPLVEKVSGKKIGSGFGFAMNPEFLREGSAVDDFFNPERIVVGVSDEKCFRLINNLYTNEVVNYKVNAPVYRVPINLAEMCKYVDNTYHALKVVFANEIGVISKELGIDSNELMRIFCEDKKLNISPYYFKPGFSFGGSCLPKDLKGLNQISRELKIESPVLSSIKQSNDIHTERAVKLLEGLGSHKFGFLGLSFKENTDDIRENPIISVINDLSLNTENRIFIYDNLVNLGSLFTNKKIKVSKNIDSLIENVEVLILSNNSRYYNKKVLKSNKIIVDLNKSISDTQRTLTLV